ncbi:hypothetical protein H6P81_019393 [Aristolochia fimbriata]|uniref:rhamnogalacturonan endolyase n=1 Tax=Aristolochia fimbriata TaxID=158543 RepID=A0AAV7DSJ9_ARIFI|nr:hypothetical protein H6P81_019393 [Aristolochia fimbriata]
MAKQNVVVTIQTSYVILSNGIVKLTISKPGGALTGIQYGGLDNLLDIKTTESQRGYWDINWNLPGGQDRYTLLQGTEFSIVQANKDIAEVSFRSSWDSSSRGTVLPLSVDKRFILRSGISGFYSYAIYERTANCPALVLSQTRLAFKLRREKFHYMAITDEKQRIMPMPEDILPPRCQELALPESVLLTNPTNPDLKGQVEDKYQYSMDNKDGGLHGWISSGPFVGFWIIFPSNEFRNGGPTKQNLTVHTGPTVLAMFHGVHYLGEDCAASFTEGEAWRKVLGPIFVYLNSTSSVSNAHDLWIDAKKQRLSEMTQWPYNFVSSPFFLSEKERGSLSGRLFVADSYVSKNLIPAKNAHIGLAPTTSAGAWQIESKGYQFWVQTDSNGDFVINNVVPGVYAVHGFVPGFVGDYLDKTLVTIHQGIETQLGNLSYNPPRDGPTLWEIGYPDRTAIGYYVPDAHPLYINKLFVNSPEKYRQYGLWDRYTDIHPKSDQVFMIGVDDPKKDWFFMHVTRRTTNRGYSPTTWNIKFNIDEVTSGIYNLRLAIAASNHAWFQVRVNNPNGAPVCDVFDMGSDNAIGRHGIHGLYQLLSVSFNSSLLVKGENIIFLTQARGGNEFLGLFYDYIRLEGPAAASEP